MAPHLESFEKSFNTIHNFEKSVSNDHKRYWNPVWLKSTRIASKPADWISPSSRQFFASIKLISVLCIAVWKKLGDWRQSDDWKCILKCNKRKKPIRIVLWVFRFKMHLIVGCRWHIEAWTDALTFCYLHWNYKFMTQITRIQIPIQRTTEWKEWGPRDLNRIIR